MKFSELIERAHATAIAKGWHEGKEKTIDRAAALTLLIVSEVTEADDELQAHIYPPETIYPPEINWVEDKPDHFIFELADIVIRLADMYGFFEWDYVDFDISAENLYPKAEVGDIYKAVDTLLTRPLRTSGQPSAYAPRLLVERVVGWWLTAGLGRANALDTGKVLVGAAVHKMNYNDTRPYRHGNKLL